MRDFALTLISLRQANRQDEFVATSDEILSEVSSTQRLLDELLDVAKGNEIELKCRAVDLIGLFGLSVEVFRTKRVEEELLRILSMNYPSETLKVIALENSQPTRDNAKPLRQQIAFLLAILCALSNIKSQMGRQVAEAIAAEFSGSVLEQFILDRTRI